MSELCESILDAQRRAAAIRPKVGGFPYLAEVLRMAGVTRLQYTVAASTSLFITGAGNVVQQDPALVLGLAEVPAYDEAALVSALRKDQAGQCTFPEFAKACWEAGVVWYDVDLTARSCTYFGAAGERYLEMYPAVQLL